MDEAGFRALLVGLAVLLLAFLPGCIGPEAAPTPTPAPTAEPTPALQGCVALPTLYARDQCYASDAIRDSDPEGCARIVNYSGLDACYGHFAEQRSDPQFCGRMRLAGDKDACYLGVARATANYSACAMVSDASLARSCGMELRDPALLCENESAGANRSLCEAVVSGSFAPCLGQAMEVKDECLARYALNASDPEACQSVTVPNMRNGCYSSLAASMGNITFCSLIDDDNLRASCVLEFGRDATTEMCRTIASHDLMLACLASAEGLPQYCQQVADYLVKDRCYDEVARTLNNASFCRPISTALYRNDCYTNISVRNADPGLCANVIPELERDKCYSAVAVANNLQSACDPIVLPSIKMPCQSTVAVQLDDPALCNAINSTASQSSYFKDRCYSTILEKDTYDYMKCGSIIVGTYADECYLRAARRYGNPQFCLQIIYEVTRRQCQQLFQ